MNELIEKLTSSQVSECACFNLRKTARAVTQFYDSCLKSSGLRGTQFTLLSVIAGNKRITISKLAHKLVMERTTLTRNLRPLARQGLVEIIPGNDKRTRFVELTPKGRNTLLNALPFWQKAQKKIQKDLGKTQFQSLLQNLSNTLERIFLQ
ncbi:MAG: MarR family winged helix-turn-helix transcriptional regulator [bacterium]